jgi:WD40 repeat protein/serine/threonine protein kinase
MATPPTNVSVYRNETLLLRKTLAPGEYVIGHDVSAEISLSVEGVTARHAILRLAPNEWAIEELDGEIFVNDEPITGSRIVFPDQRIRLGKALITLQQDKPQESELETLSPQTAAVRDLLPQMICGERKYELGAVIGHGGMGVVLDAREVPVGRNVAMKLMRNAMRRDEVERFVREAQITAQLEHPNIVPVHELNVNEREQPFFTMKYVRGVSLGEVLRDLAAKPIPADNCKFSLDSLLTAFQKVCDAIAFAHSKRIIHRDLKPDNIMLGEYGEVLVMDWGLAKVLGGGPTSRLEEQPDVSGSKPMEDERDSYSVTQAGIVIGTLQYMPPEQARGEVAVLDEKSDIYSLGAILYHILTLRPPFEGRDPNEIRENVCDGKIGTFDVAGSLSHTPGGRVPDSLRAVVRKAISKDPQDRYDSVRSLQGDVAAYQTGFAPSAEQATAWKLLALFLRRHRTSSIAAAAVLISGIAFTVSLALARNKAQVAERFATKQRNTTENHLYVSDLLQAGRDVAENRSQSAREILDRHRLELSGRDLRGWEWFLLDAELNQDRLRASAHAGGVYGLAVTTDGTRLATGGADGDIAIWGVSGFVPEGRLRAAHQGTAFCVAWQSSGQLLASAGADGRVCVWDVPSQTKVAEFRLAGGTEIRAMAWHPVNDAIAFGGLHEKVYLWRPLATTSSPPEELLVTQNGISSLRWSEDGKHLVVGKLGAKMNVVVLDVASRSIVMETRPTSGSDILAVAISPSGQFVAAGSKHGAVIVFDARSGKTVFEETSHRGFVRALAWSPDGTQLASAGEDRTIRITQPLDKGKPCQILRGHSGDVDALAWVNIGVVGNPDLKSQAIFSGSADGTLRAWLPNTIEHVGFSGKDGNWISALRWSRDSQRIAMVNFRDRIHIISRAAGLSLPLYCPPRALFDIAWSPGGNRLACARRDPGLVEIIEMATGRSAAVCSWPQTERIAWSPSGNYLVATSTLGASTWDVRTGVQVATIARSCGCAAWHADDQRVALGCIDGAIEVWDAVAGVKSAQWREKQSPPPGSLPLMHDPPTRINDIAWSPNGQYVAFVAVDKAAGLLDAQDGRLIRFLPGHTGGINRLTWSPDGSRLATCGKDGLIRVFDPLTGDLVARIDHGGSASELRAIDWSFDGRQLATGGDDTFLRVWDSSRSYELSRVEALHHQLERQADTNSLHNLALACAQLGLCDWTREALARAHQLTPEDVLLTDVRARAEDLLVHALDAVPNTSHSRSLQLLNAICDKLETKDIAAAVDAFQKLAREESGPAYLAFAQNYFSRAAWNVTWFPSQVDPQKDLNRWRELANAEGSVTDTTHLLRFSFRNNSPDKLKLSPSPTKQPIVEPFGMIADTYLSLCVGKWRLHARGRDGIRVIVDGRPLLERWEGRKTIDEICEWEQSTSDRAHVKVEHFARTEQSEIEILIEPVIATQRE